MHQLGINIDAMDGEPCLHTHSIRGTSEAHSPASLPFTMPAPNALQTFAADFVFEVAQTNAVPLMELWLHVGFT